MKLSARTLLLGSVLLAGVAGGAVLSHQAWAARSADPDRAAAYFDEARTRQAQGDLRAALIQMRNAVQQAPDNDSYRRFLGELALASGDPVAAEKEFSVVLRRGDDATVDVLLARALLAQDKFQPVIDAVRATADDKVHRLEQHIVLAGAYLGLDRLDDATRELQAARALDAASAGAAYGLARVALQRGDVDQAVRELDGALKRQPDFVDAWLLSAHLAQQQQRPGDAAAALDQAAKSAPADPRIGIARIQLLLRSGRVKEAAELAKGVVERAPGNVAAAYTEAVALVAAHNYAEADKRLVALEDRLQAVPEAVLLIAMVKSETGQAAQAERNFLKYLEARPADERARRALAALHLRAGNAAAAIADLSPRQPAPALQEAESLRLLAGAYLRDGQIDKARATFQRLAAGGPLAGDARAMLSGFGSGGASSPGAMPVPVRGQLLAADYVFTRQYEEALAEIRKLRAAEPANPAFADLEARVLASAGDADGAIQEFRTTLALKADYWPAVDGWLKVLASRKDAAGAEALLRARLAEPQPREGDASRLAGLLIAANRSGEAASLLDGLWRTHKDWRDVGQVLLGLQLQAKDPAAADLARALAGGAAPEHAQAVVGALVAGGQVPLALELVDKALAAQPASLPLQLRKSEALLAAGRGPDALRTLEDAAQRNPKNNALLAALANLQLRQGVAAKAERTLAQLDPADPATPRLKAQFLVKTGRAAEAVPLLEKLEAAQPSPAGSTLLYEARLAAGRKEAALAGLRAWIAARPGDEQAQLMLAQHELTSGDLANAEAHFQRLLASHPEDPALLNNVAWLRHRRGADDALDFARRAHDKAPASPQVLDTLGTILVDAGQSGAGLPHLERAAQLAPADADIQINYARALSGAGRKDAARQILQAKLTAVPGSRRPDLERALADLH